MSRHSVRAFSENGQSGLLLTSFHSNKESEVRKLKVSHDINVYLLRGGVKVIIPFPLDRFNLNG